jgi:hypothetical protein
MLICSICYDNENDNYVSIAKMFTKCNHYFHKECFYRANRGKSNKTCPMCRSPHYKMYSIETYYLSEIKRVSADIVEKLCYIKNILQNNKFVISGSFAVYTYQKLYGKNPKWEYGDIDVYIKKDNVNIENENLKLIQEFSERETKCCGYCGNVSYQDNINYITNVKKYNVVGKTTFNMDLIQVDEIELYQIVESFYLDCCKIIIELKNDYINLIINNEFYVDSFLIKNNKEKTLNRINKYRERGFNCYNYDHYQLENLIESNTNSQDVQDTLDTQDVTINKELITIISIIIYTFLYNLLFLSKN